MAQAFSKTVRTTAINRVILIALVWLAAYASFQEVCANICPDCLTSGGSTVTCTMVNCNTVCSAAFVTPDLEKPSALEGPRNKVIALAQAYHSAPITSIWKPPKH